MKERVLIMKKKTCVAMLLAGGQGSRLGVLTKKVAKPAVPYGGKYRIIDFPLSNCTNSGIDTVGVLTQYMPLELNSYIGSGARGIWTCPPAALFRPAALSDGQDGRLVIAARQTPSIRIWRLSSSMIRITS